MRDAILIYWAIQHIDWLVQERHNSIAKALEVRLFCTNPSISKDNSSQALIYQAYKERGLILGLRPANERRRYKVTPSLIGWAQA